MAFLLQTDSGSIDGANAYIDESFFDSYHGDRGNDVSSYTTQQKEQAIVQATDYLDQRFRFVGYQRRIGQRTAWPRFDAEDADEHLRAGIPSEVKEAVAEYALIALSTGLALNPTPDRDSTGRVIKSKSERVGPIDESVEYAGGAAFERPKYPAADHKLYASGLAIRGGQLRRA